MLATSRPEAAQVLLATPPLKKSHQIHIGKQL